MTGLDAVRLTQYARGGGCACKIPPGELAETIGRLKPNDPGTDLMGIEHGDDGAVVRVSPALAVVVTADFFTPVVDDAYTFGRIAATNALSDIYAMGGEPLVAVNLLGWPRDKLPAELAAEVLRGGLDTGRAAHCHVAGGHSIDDPEPKYGMAVTGTADPAALLRIDAGQPGLTAAWLAAVPSTGDARLIFVTQVGLGYFGDGHGPVVCLGPSTPGTGPWPRGGSGCRSGRARPVSSPRTGRCVHGSTVALDGKRLELIPPVNSAARGGGRL